MAETGKRSDPLRAYNFKLKIDGVDAARFTECKGLNVKIPAISFREAGSTVVHKLPGPVEYGDVTLSYGLTESKELWDWIMATAKGEIVRKGVSITMLDNDGTKSAFQWNLTEAWPSGWEGASLNAQSREAAFESITISFENLERDRS